ncbi:ribosomal protection-like ABC-F family protein [Enterococcus alishanensis]
MSTIELKHLTFGYDGQGDLLFDDVNLVMDSSWKLGLVGRNGRGKTTLLSLLQGHLTYQGDIVIPLSTVYFPLNIQNENLLTYDALIEVSSFELWQLEREMNHLNLSPDLLWQPYSTLSGGEQTKVLLACLFTEENFFPLIDEPTNHLDAAGRQQVAKYLQQKAGYIVISHDRNFLDEVSNHTLAIEKNQIVLYQGNFSTYETQKETQDSYEQAENSKLKKEIGRLKQTAAEKAAWSQSREKDKYGKPSEKGSGAIGDTGFIGARAARVMKRSKQMEGRMQSQIEFKEGLLKNIETVDQLSLNYQPTYHKQLIKVENLRLSYGMESLFSSLSFEINQGEIVALTGANGSGKSSVIQYLLENFTGISDGEVLRPQKLAISYVRQNYEDNQGTLKAFAEKERLDYSSFLNNLRKLGMERNVFHNKIEQMSMGQRKKVELAKSLAQPAELYIWDEPLNYLDVFNQKQLEELLVRINPTMLIVEHDERFLKNVSAGIVKLG